MSEADVPESYEVSSALMIPYRLIGSRMPRMLPFFESLQNALMKSNLRISLDVYISYMLFVSGIAFGVVFLVTIVFTLVFGVWIVTSLILATALGLAALASAFIALYVYPAIVSDSRGRHLNEELPYLSIHMAVLSQAGLPPERIFKSVMTIASKRLKSVAAEEARNIVRDVSFLGLDIVTSIGRNASRSPSKTFAELLKGLISVAQTGGDMTKYFLSSARSYMDNARIASRQLSESLGNIAELYVSIMVVFPLVVVIMLAVMGVMGGSLGGISILMIMYLVAYIAVPAMAIVVLVFLDGLMPPR